MGLEYIWLQQSTHFPNIESHKFLRTSVFMMQAQLYALLKKNFLGSIAWDKRYS